MIQVGTHKPGTDRPYTYTDVFFDKDGWADSDDFRPVTYDLMLLRDENNRTIVGWYTGSGWDGLRYKGQEVKHWKRKLDDET